MRIIVNSIAILIMICAFTGFWVLMLKLIKPARKLWWWIGYIAFVLLMFGGIRYYLVYQVDLFGSFIYPWLQLWRTESYGILMGIFLAIPLLAVVAIIQWLVNRNVNKMDNTVGESRRHLFQVTAVAIPSATIGVASYNAFIGQEEVIVTHNEFAYKNLPASLKNYKIVQLSDVHLGPCIDLNDFDELIDLTLKEKPNRVIITGDLIDKTQWLPELCTALRRLAAQVPDGIDYILGNHEHFHNVTGILNAFRTETPMRVYVNSNLKIFGGNQPVYIVGVDYDVDRTKENRNEMLDQALQGIPSNAFVILLAHHPEFFKEAFERNIPLTLSGHTHGGQIIINGENVVPLGIPYIKGIYSHGNSLGYVNSGSGHWYPIRLNCPREVTVITFNDK